ncbi:YceI family protein [Mesonia ostreae]|uniref:YceI family protein n=1 Tax=Mesonia ostreae TaxID=861110 RepID=A0ABU2KM45_9FLAO|nr:YceI family protein [Mesonia ostreae]MDT0295783.1 YceI family protein [Mesonia ostreae]
MKANFFFFVILFLSLGFQKIGAQAEVVVEVTTNVNQFSCECKGLSREHLSKYESYHEILIPVANFDCPKKMMERDLLKLFEADKFPEIQLFLEPQSINSKALSVKIAIRIKEILHKYEVNLVKIIEDKQAFYIGSQVISLDNYGLEPPTKALGFVKVRDHVNIKFKIPVHFLAQP